MKAVLPILSLAILFGASACTPSGDTPSASATDSSFKKTARADRSGEDIVPYPFDTCAVQWHKGFKDGKPKHRRVYKGHEVLFCCTPCVKAFDMNPDPYMPRIMAAAGTATEVASTGP